MLENIYGPLGGVRGADNVWSFPFDPDHEILLTLCVSGGGTLSFDLRDYMYNFRFSRGSQDHRGTMQPSVFQGRNCRNTGYVPTSFEGGILGMVSKLKGDDVWDILK
jgi:hypothetical protein